MPDTIQTIDLLASLRQEWLKLPLAAMRDVGPAVQTLGGLLKLTRRETFSKIREIATKARVPVATARKHLKILDDCGWIENKGRQRTSGGRPRRTCTITIAKKTRDAMGEYGVLPWWACCKTRSGPLLWSSKAVLSVVVAQLMKLVAVVERDEIHTADTTDETWGAIGNLGDADRFRFSLDTLREKTGLSRGAIIQAKEQLRIRKIITLIGDKRDDGGTATDSLMPSESFRAKVTPAGEGRCYVEF